MSRRVLVIAGFLIAVAAFAGGVRWVAYGSALDQLADRGRADLTVASDRLVGQLQQYRELAVLMADHPVLSGLLMDSLGTEGITPARRAQAEALLLRVADKTGSQDVHVLSASGRVLASSGRNGARQGEERAGPAFARAMHGALGAHHSETEAIGRRSFTFAAPVFAATGRVLGAIEVEVNLWSIEAVWVGDPKAIFFTDAAGVVFVSNRTELLFRARDLAAARAAGRAFDYDPASILPFPAHQNRVRDGHDLWRVNGGRYLPTDALHLVRPLPVIGMTGELLLDAAPARALADLQAGLAAALCLVFGAFLFVLSERRRRLTERLGIEERTNSELEHRVAERTQELSTANAQLRQAQKDLVQAGKLSALGQMSAGISHELNQPLMAIQSYAENAGQFLDRGTPERAAENLGRISELARRMGRIIKNLRAFARQESEPMGDVDLVGVVEAALELARMKLEAAGVAVDWEPPGVPVRVRGGEVRLQQVVMNLLSNAADAMAESSRRQIGIDLSEAGGTVRLAVRDTGPGIAEPDRMFDPFYTTKEVGSSEGMGLGLSISYGLVQSFGGAIRGRNLPEGGAEFTVELTAAALREAAE